MTLKLFVALFVGLFAGMFILFFTNFPVGWVFFAYLFIAVFGGITVLNHPWLIAAGFLISSLVVLGAGLLGIYASSQVGGWPWAHGVITRSWFCTRTVNGEAVYSGPCIEYSYTVNEQTYEASSIETGEFAQQFWFRIPETYNQGREVKVYYNPNDRGISRLSTEIHPRDWITVLIGGAMAALSAFTLFWVLYNPKKLRARSHRAK